MLSRVANCLYWMSRHIERAENTARLVDVNLQLLLDISNLDDLSLAEHWMPVIQSSGDEELFHTLHEQTTGANVTEFLVFQSENPNSIFSAISQARENARMVRDQITVELWEELNRLYLFLKSPDARNVWQRSPADFFQHVKRSSLLIVGVIYATVSHNEGWHFMQLGKFIERADKITRILDVRHAVFPARGAPEEVTQRDVLEWSAVLRSCTAWDAYKAIHGSEVHPSLVAEFLLTNEEFPRSVRFCIERFDAALRSVSGVAARRFSNDAERLSGRLLAELQFGTIGEFLDQYGLHEFLDVLQLRLNAIGIAVFDAYISQPFYSLEDEMMVQQEMQQQQQRFAQMTNDE
jgi:uncharacterized alpha-E superfamily protein